MGVFGYESMQDVSTTMLLIARDEINAELTKRKEAIIDKKMSNLLNAIKELNAEEDFRFKIISTTGDEIFTNQVEGILDNDRAVSII